MLWLQDWGFGGVKVQERTASQWFVSWSHLLRECVLQQCCSAACKGMLVGHDNPAHVLMVSVVCKGLCSG